MADQSAGDKQIDKIVYFGKNRVRYASVGIDPYSITEITL